MKVAVSYLKSAFSKEETLKKIEKSEADYIHVDLMDGIFVEKNNLNVSETISLLKDCQKPLDIHLMLEHPEKTIEELERLNPKTITVHVEIDNIEHILENLTKKKILKGLAINPETDCKMLLPYLNKIDQVLVMSVHPGKGGQSFLPESIQKVKEIYKIRQEKKLSFQIAMDGGINEETAFLVKDYVDILISGSYICMSDNFDEKILKLKQIDK